MTLYSMVITKASEEDIASIFQGKRYICVLTHADGNLTRFAISGAPVSTGAVKLQARQLPCKSIHNTMTCHHNKVLVSEVR